MGGGHAQCREKEHRKEREFEERSSSISGRLRRKYLLDSKTELTCRQLNKKSLKISGKVWTEDKNL